MKAIRGSLRITVLYPRTEGVTLQLSYLSETGEVMKDFDPITLPHEATLNLTLVWGVLHLVAPGEANLSFAIDPLTAEVKMGE